MLEQRRSNMSGSDAKFFEVKQGNGHAINDIGNRALLELVHSSEKCLLEFQSQLTTFQS